MYLEDVYRTLSQAHPDHDLPHPVPVLWLGGSSDEVGQLGWDDELRALAAARGFALTIIKAPASRHAETMKAVNDYSGPAIFVWTPYAGARSDAYINASSPDCASSGVM